MKTLVVQNFRNIKVGEFLIDLKVIDTRINKIIFTQRDTNKFIYEKGYEKRIERTIKDNKFKFNNCIIDISKIELARV